VTNRTAVTGGAGLSSAAEPCPAPALPSRRGLRQTCPQVEMHPSSLSERTRFAEGSPTQARFWAWIRVSRPTSTAKTGEFRDGIFHSDRLLGLVGDCQDEPCVVQCTRTGYATAQCQSPVGPQPCGASILCVLSLRSGERPNL